MLLKSTYWLSDIDINMALHTIKQQWSNVSTQDCLLIQSADCFKAPNSPADVLFAQVTLAVSITILSW